MHEHRIVNGEFVEIAAEPDPAFHTKGSAEYHAERERALTERLEAARKHEAEIKAQHAEELRPLHAHMEALETESATYDRENANARKGVNDIREDIETKRRLIESLKSEIASMEGAIERVEQNVIPSLERGKADMQKCVATSRANCAEVHKKWRRKLHEAERESSKLSMRLTRLQLRRPR